LSPFSTWTNTPITNWGYLLKVVYTWVVKLLACLHESSNFVFFFSPVKATKAGESLIFHH
jgi:hypothetical protein